MIFLNNSATSYPKPEEVIKVHEEYLRRVPLGQHRDFSDHVNDDVADKCRKNLANLFHIKEKNHIFFTSGATEAANIVIRGFKWKNKVVIATASEHNSILRPLYNSRENLEIRLVHCDEHGYIDLQELSRITDQTCDAIFVNHCSNVSGAVQDLDQIADIAKKNKAALVVDASQSAGCIPIDVEKNGIDFLIFTGHKHLLGPQGTGGFYAKNTKALRATNFGGTGFDSSRIIYDLDDDQVFEVGTPNMPGIASLNAAVEYLNTIGIDQIREKENLLIDYLIDELSKLPLVEIYSGKKDFRGPLFSFNIKGLSPSDVAYILYESYHIIVRSGLLCAPLLMNDLKIKEYGCVRVSPSFRTSQDELDVFVNAIKDICKSLI